MSGRGVGPEAGSGAEPRWTLFLMLAPVGMLLAVLSYALW